MMHNATYQANAWDGGMFPRLPGQGGWDDPDLRFAGGVFSSAPRYLRDWGGSSESYDNHKWSDDI